MFMFGRNSAWAAVSRCLVVEDKITVALKQCCLVHVEVFRTFVNLSVWAFSSRRTMFAGKGAVILKQ